MPAISAPSKAISATRSSFTTAASTVTARSAACACAVPPPKPGMRADVEKPLVLFIEPGLALDAEGNELIVRERDSCLKFNLWEMLSEADQQTVTKELTDNHCDWYSKPLFVCLHHHECPLGASTPITPDSPWRDAPQAVGEVPRRRPGLRLAHAASRGQAPRDMLLRRPLACDGLLLARVNHLPGAPGEARGCPQLVRRRVGTYPFTTITGINWRHGVDHHREYVRHLLREGLVIDFSRPVLVETLKRGVVDTYHIESKSTRHPNIIELRGEIAACRDKTTTELRYRVTRLEECPESADRVLVVVRSGFILDECCRPVDGLNVGGRVPDAPDEKPHHFAPGPVDPCQHFADPPWGYAPWRWATGPVAGRSRVGSTSKTNTPTTRRREGRMSNTTNTSTQSGRKTTAAAGCGCGCGGNRPSGGSGGSSGCTCNDQPPACPGSGILRPNFFAGQLLTEDDLQQITVYQNGKRRLTNRYVFGTGVVCGLEVVCAGPKAPGSLMIQPGYALDCCGNDIVLSCPYTIDVNAMVREAGLDCGDPCGDADNPRKYLLCVRYTECLSEPVNAYSPGGTTTCVNTRVQESCTFELRCQPKKPEPQDTLVRRLRDLLDDEERLALSVDLVRWDEFSRKRDLLLPLNRQEPFIKLTDDDLTGLLDSPE